jgi:D-alanine-D-alanine ligase
MIEAAHIAVVFNEPLIETGEGKKFISESGQITGFASRSEIAAASPMKLVDLSEVGVIEEREQVENALKNKGYRTSLFNINGDIQRLIKFIETEKPDLIFNLCESLKGEAIHEMHVAGIFELTGSHYTGAATLALGICLNKSLTKQILGANSIPTARHMICKDAETINLDDLALQFPMIVKPSHEDASIGIENSSVVKNIEMLRERISYIIRCFNQPALVEEFIEGRELNVAIIGNERPQVLPISEIDFSKLPPDYPKIVTYNAKWVEGSAEFIGTVGTCPAHIRADEEKRVKDVALKAYQIMEIRDYARVDIRLDKSGTPYVLEVNPNPDISNDSGFARSARTAGLMFEDMIAKIVETALERSRQS